MLYINICNFAVIGYDLFLAYVAVSFTFTLSFRLLLANTYKFKLHSLSYCKCYSWCCPSMIFQNEAVLIAE